MKNLLFLVNSVDVGGIEKYLLRFLKHTQGEFNATVICKSGHLGHLQAEYESVGIKLISYKVGFLSIKSFLGLYKFIKKNNFDTVCDFTGDFSGVPMLLSRIAKVPKRITFYRGSVHQFKPVLKNLIYAKFVNLLVKKNSTSILANSKAAFDFFLPRELERNTNYKIIKNGLPIIDRITTKQRLKLRESLNIPHDALLVGHVGRFASAKNHQFICEVAKEVISSDSRIYFFCCGRDVKNELTSIINSMGIQERFLVDESRDDIFELMQTFDLFFFPSLNEGHPNALIESMSLGVPFVASNIRSIKETIPNYCSSYLVPTNDIFIAKKCILESFKNMHNFNRTLLSDWTVRNYDGDKLFKEFLTQLI